MKFKHLLLLLLPAALFLIACPDSSPEIDAVSSPNPPTLTWMVPQEVPDTPNASQADYYDFGWQTFVALNWPANPAYRGMPDTTLSIGATGPGGVFLNTVWEAWKEQYEIFLPYGVNPGEWNTGYTANAQNLKVLRMFSKFDSSIVSDAFNEAFAGPLITQDSQYVRYEVRTNESEYDYYTQNHYYNADSQQVAVSNGTFVGFPKGNDPLSNSLGDWARYGATEVKASWRVFTATTPANVKNRYFRKKAILVNSYGVPADTVEIGLTAMHILRLTHSTHATWYWASFEQVDNVKLQPQFGGTVPAHPTFNSDTSVKYAGGFSYQGTTTPPPGIVPGQPLPAAYPVNVSSPPFVQPDSTLNAINMQYNQLLQGTPFQYYQMIGTVNPPVQGGPTYTNTSSTYSAVTVNTSQLSNSTMETYFYNTNCISCHISGYPQLPPAPFDSASIYSSSNDQVFTFLPGLAKSGTPPLNKKRVVPKR